MKGCWVCHTWNLSGMDGSFNGQERNGRNGTRNGKEDYRSAERSSSSSSSSSSVISSRSLSVSRSRSPLLPSSSTSTCRFLKISSPAGELSSSRAQPVKRMAAKKGAPKGMICGSLIALYYRPSTNIGQIYCPTKRITHGFPALSDWDITFLTIFCFIQSISNQDGTVGIKRSIRVPFTSPASSSWSGPMTSKSVPVSSPYSRNLWWSNGWYRLCIWWINFLCFLI